MCWRTVSNNYKQSKLTQYSRHLQSTSDHPERCLRFSIEALTVVHDYNRGNSDQQINIRIGLNTGGAVAGVIGTKKVS